MHPLGSQDATSTGDRSHLGALGDLPGLDRFGPRPLADLHRHLDGSMRAQTLRALAAAEGVAMAEIPRFFAGMGLDAALACFALTLATLGRAEAVAQVVDEICADAAAEGVGTLELRFAPQLHGQPGEPTPDLTRMRRMIAAAAEGLAGRAGLLLCALYGEPPALVEALVDMAIAHPAVVGVDLAGGPAAGASFGMADYGPAFQRARRAGLGVTVHAGEGRPPTEIAVAIAQLGAQRIGHGTTLLADPRVVDLVRERGVTIEACIRSNVHVGAIATPAQHPIGALLAQEVRVCICTDNTLLSAVDAPGEHALARTLPGMDDAALLRAIGHGHAARFGREGGR